MGVKHTLEDDEAIGWNGFASRRRKEMWCAREASIAGEGREMSEESEEEEIRMRKGIYS